MPIEITGEAKALVSRPAESRQIGAGVSVQDPRSEVVSQVSDAQLQQQESAQEAQDVQQSEQQLNNAIERLKDHVQNLQRDLQFSVHEETGRTIVTVVDSTSGKTVRQIPSEEVLALANHFVGDSNVPAGDDEALQGLIFSEQA